LKSEKTDEQNTETKQRLPFQTETYRASSSRNIPSGPGLLVTNEQVVEMRLRRAPGSTQRYREILSS